MARLRIPQWSLGIALLFLFAWKQVFAIGPSYIMFYGGQLDAPLVLKMDHTMQTGFLWATPPYYRSKGTLQRETLPARLNGRSYLNFAVFWGRWDSPPITPETASQHGRLYLPTASESAAVVVSAPGMTGCDGRCNPPAVPIPVDLEDRRSPLGHRIGLVAGWLLDADDLAAAQTLGVPGL